MRLPLELYQMVRECFAHHVLWHLARVPANRHLRAPGGPFPGLLALDEEGSGEQFLRFNREMMRQFRWLERHAPGGPYTIAPWDRLPPWVGDALDAELGPEYLQGAYQEIDRLVGRATADQLGAFIEANGRSEHPHRNIHNVAHGTIGDLEAGSQPPPEFEDADMGHPATAPHNEHFWGLHGWIDDLFAEWQRRHGEVPDQSPLEPPASGHGRFPADLWDRDVLRVRVEPLRRFASVFDDG